MRPDAVRRLNSVIRALLIAGVAETSQNITVTQRATSLPNDQRLSKAVSEKEG
jgi:hypothetical protein